jgi:hypothetical protein
LLTACDAAIQSETKQMKKYVDIMPWRSKRHEESIEMLKSAKEKILATLNK